MTRFFAQFAGTLLALQFPTLLHAQDSAPAKTVTLAEYSTMGTQILDKLESYGALLASVKDLPTAKTAKPKIEKLTVEMRSLTTEVAKLGQVPRSVEEAFYKDKKNQERADAIMKSMVGSSRRITADQAVFNELKQTLTDWERAMRNRAESPPTPPQAPAAPKAPTAPTPPPAPK
jgi:hypothetical protein